MKHTKILCIAACGMLLSFSAQAQQDHNAMSTNADNTAVNNRDRNDSESTADQAQNDLSDRQIMQKIRKSVIADKSLSTYAHNVKIIAENGQVTLKGPVRSAAEKQTIERKAIKIAGADNVTNEMSIKGQN